MFWCFSPTPDCSHQLFALPGVTQPGPLSWVRVRWGFLGFAYEWGWMGATCQHDWQVGLMLINFNGSCQGTPGAPTWRVSPTDTFGRAHRHIYKHVHTFLCDTSLWSCTSEVFFFDKCLLKTDCRDHERLYGHFLCVTQPFNTSGPKKTQTPWKSWSHV